MTYDLELDAVLAAVREAGILLRNEASRIDGPRGHGDHADVDAEIGIHLTRRLTALFPYDGIVIEEPISAARPSRSGRAFVIDPHDGTRDFLLGHRETSISVALVDSGRLALGVVHAPFSTRLSGPGGLLVAWAEGGPISRDGVPIPVQVPPMPPRCLVSTSLLARPGKRTEHERRLAPMKLEACSSIATRLALVAVGEADLTITYNPLQPWDFAGGQALLLAAGGQLVDGRGVPITWEGVAPTPHDTTLYVGARRAERAAEMAERLRGSGDR